MLLGRSPAKKCTYNTADDYIIYLVEGVAGDELVDVVGAEVLDEADDAGGVADGDVPCLPEDGLVHEEALAGRGEALVLPETGHPHQHVTVLAGDEGRVYAHVPGYRRPRPARRERPPRPLDPLERKVTEVRLQRYFNC